MKTVKMMKWVLVSVSSVSIAAVLALLSMGSAAVASPMDHEIEHGKVKFELEHRLHSHSIVLNVKSGDFTYDGETKAITNLALRSHGRDLIFAKAIALEGSDSDWAENWGNNGRHLGFQIVGLEVPRGNLPGYLARHSNAHEMNLRIAGKWSAYSGSTGDRPVPTSPMPEPTSAVLFAAGLLVAGRSIGRRDARRR